MQATLTEPSWSVTPEKIQKAVQWIVEAARPVRVIMFGSQARGEAKRDSDVDLMVVMARLSDEERLKEMVRLRDLLRPLRLPVDVLVVPAAKLEYWGDTPGNVYYDASVGGVVLYEQGNSSGPALLAQSRQRRKPAGRGLGGQDSGRRRFRLPLPAGR